MAPQHASPVVDGAKLRTARQEAGLTASELARLARISAGYMSQIETGVRPTVSPGCFNRIVLALGANRRDLLRTFEQPATGRGAA